ncbi:maleylpyruvate isomerase N-terminal domain-containing protein [Pseudonocardia sp. HH130629-09]|uniref:maleylpyruvate isomerase N-terminal domain-containing protein n=1 Tax=Pseudonocardia sp. HH130629-09 TaxID=1641402 RepID=UPI000761280E|nr:maleylpyruvate isomerase N-terminal domain-containing protein [Pseudonocardia sp. HH130629-09]
MTTSDLPDAAVVAVSARYRRGFADLVFSLDAAQLAAPSLCAGWDVRTDAGHLVSALTTTVPSFLVQVLPGARERGPGGRPGRAAGGDPTDRGAGRGPARAGRKLRRPARHRGAAR